MAYTEFIVDCLTNKNNIRQLTIKTDVDCKYYLQKEQCHGYYHMYDVDPNDLYDSTQLAKQEFIERKEYEYATELLKLKDKERVILYV